MDSTFADILLPLPLKETYTYRVPAEFASRISPGMRVIVPFGRKKSFAGIVAAIHRLPLKREKSGTSPPCSTTCRW